MNNNQELGIRLTSMWHGLLEVMDSSVSTQNLVTELPHYFSFPNWEKWVAGSEDLRAARKFSVAWEMLGCMKLNP